MEKREAEKRSGVIVVSPWGGHHLTKEGTITGRSMRERLSIVRELAKRGYRVFVPVIEEAGKADEKTGKPDAGTAWFLANVKAFSEKAKRLGARTMRLAPPESGSLEKLDLSWIRDKWTQLGGSNYVSSIHGWPFTSRRVRFSALGTGGRIVGGTNFLLVHEYLRTNHATRGALDDLEKQGCAVYGMPSAKNLRGDLDASHLDLSLGVAPAAGKRHVIVVTGGYLSDNRGLLERVARETRSRIVEVPKEEEGLFPANFLVLPDGKVLMTGGAPKTKALMERAGARVFTTIPLKTSPFWGGGLRCVTNTFYRSKRSGTAQPRPSLR